MSQRIHETTLRVRYQETDQMGVVYHSNYLVYFEVGRTSWLRSKGMAYSELEKQGVRLAVTEIGCKYLSSLRYDEEARVVTWISGMGKSRITFRYRLLRDDEGEPTLIAEGFSTLACLDREGRPRRIPDDVRTAYEADRPDPAEETER